MAKRGENIYKRKDGRWEARYIIGRDVSGKIKYKYIYAKTYREVKAKLRNICGNKTNMTAKAVDRRFGYYCDQWLKLKRSRVKESTFVKYYNCIENHIKPMLGNFYTDGLNTVILEEFGYELLTNGKAGNKRGLAPKTVKDILAVLACVLKYAGSELNLDVSNIDIIYPREQQKDIKILSVEEQKALMRCLSLDMDSCKFGIMLAMLTGMRIGEICALKWKNILLEQRAVIINSTVQRIQELPACGESKTKIVFTQPKSNNSNRCIPLTNHAAELCLKMRKQDPEAFVLTGSRDCFMEPRALQYRFKKIARECGIEKISFHTLRHTFATRCVEVGFEIKSLSEILGHANSKITLDRYVHPSFKLKAENMEKLSAVGL